MKYFFFAILIFFVSTLSLNAAPPAPIPHYVGELYGGGVVIQVDCPPSDHGLIAALEDQSPSMVTYADAVTLAATCPDGPHGGVFSQWQLPTAEQLLIVCQHQNSPGANIIPAYNKVVPGLNVSISPAISAGYYWSSTPISSTLVHVLFMENGWVAGASTLGQSVKTAKHYVRAVRTF